MRTYYRPVAGLLLLALPLLGLKCEKEDVVKANQFDITVRVTGEHLDGLGAEIEVNSTRNVLNPTTGPTLTHAYGSSVSQTYTLGTFGIHDQVITKVAFRNVSCYTTLQPRFDSNLKVEVLANGRWVGGAELKATSSTRFGNFVCDPYWLNTDVGDGNEWD